MLFKYSCIDVLNHKKYIALTYGLFFKKNFNLCILDGYAYLYIERHHNMIRLFRLTNKNHRFNFNQLIRNNPSRSFSNSYIRYRVNSDKLVDEGN